MAMKFQELDKLETRHDWAADIAGVLLLKIVSTKSFRNIEQSLTNLDDKYLDEKYL